MFTTFVITDTEPLAAPGGYAVNGYYEPFSGSFARDATPRELERWRTDQMADRGGPKRGNPGWYERQHRCGRCGVRLVHYRLHGHRCPRGCGAE